MELSALLAVRSSNVQASILTKGGLLHLDTFNISCRRLHGNTAHTCLAAHQSATPVCAGHSDWQRARSRHSAAGARGLCDFDTLPARCPRGAGLHVGQHPVAAAVDAAAGRERHADLTRRRASRFFDAAHGIAGKHLAAAAAPRHRLAAPVCASQACAAHAAACRGVCTESAGLWQGLWL